MARPERRRAGARAACLAGLAALVLLLAAAPVRAGGLDDARAAIRLHD